MGDRTAIEWSDATWNPISGCHKVSPGCDNCYAERITERFHGKGSFEKIVLHPERLGQPLRWKKSRMVFVNSMSDLFHKDVPNSFIASVFAIMGLAGRHTFQVLTKRPRRMLYLLNDDGFKDEVAIRGWEYDPFGEIIESERISWPFPNVWLGVSVEDQKRADFRIPLLLDTPAAVRFLSCEPLLGPIDLEMTPAGGDILMVCEECHDTGRFLGEECYRCQGIGRVHWVIVGGESGPKARPMHPDWARSLRGQSVAAEVPFFFKQWGEWVPGQTDEIRKRDKRLVLPDGSRVYWTSGTSSTLKAMRNGAAILYHAGKKLSGRKLDGRTWDEMPSAKVGAAS